MNISFYYFQETSSEIGRKSVKMIMAKKGLNPSLVDDKNRFIPGQPGELDDVLKNDMFGKGLA